MDISKGVFKMVFFILIFILNGISCVFNFLFITHHIETGNKRMTPVSIFGFVVGIVGVIFSLLNLTSK